MAFRRGWRNDDDELQGFVRWGEGGNVGELVVEAAFAALDDEDLVGSRDVNGKAVIAEG